MSILLFSFLCHFQLLFAFSNQFYKEGQVFLTALSQNEASSDAEAKGDADGDVGGVTLKMAFDSQWGVADMSEEKSERFTSGESLDMVHRLRRCSDAVLVGRTTVERDDCTLTVRRVTLGDDQKQPIRVIIDPDRNLVLNNCQIAKDGLPSIIFYVRSSFEQTRSEEFPNVTFIGMPAKRGGGKLSTRDICEVLKKEHGILHIMVEGGPATARCFLEEKMVDRAILVHAPVSFKKPLPSNLSPSDFREAGLEMVEHCSLGVDSTAYYSRPKLPWPSNLSSSWP